MLHARHSNAERAVKTFTLRLQDATQARQIQGLTSFVGEDAGGSFGILAGHARMMSTLSIGLARFRVGTERWQYLALPAGVLYFCDNVLTVSTRRYLLDDDYTRISQALQQQLLAEEHALQRMKQSLHRLEEEILKRLWNLSRRTTG